MLLWMILTVMTVLAAVGIAIPLLRRRDAVQVERDDAVTVLKGQLGEIEAQAAAGALAAPEADALKSDLKRRVLAEARQGETPARPLSDRSLIYVALALAAIVALGGTALYVKMGRPDVPSSPAMARTGQGAQGVMGGGEGHPQGDVSAMIGQLETQMRETPNNPEGWRMLGWSYLRTGRPADAAMAYGKAAALQPDNPEHLSAQGEATVLAAQGSVTPAAEAIFRKALSVDPADARARYYLAVGKDQRGERDAAMNDWIALIKSAPPDAPWAAEVRDFVEKIAAERKIDLSGRLPPAPTQTAEAPGAPRGPNAEQVAAAQNMSEGDRQQMVQGMISGLAERLKQNPRDRAGWERLLRARMVMGDSQQAAADYRTARQAFAGSPADQQALRDAASQLGVPGA
ncbi:MAG: c-type cytochrome biogenesis protein CcmI [Pseudomonadota bacterium]